jgi:hypothetical protein
MGEGGERKKKSPEKMAFRGFLFQAGLGVERHGLFVELMMPG